MSDKQQCHSCFKLYEAHSDLNGESKPQPGDFSICIGCGAFSKFDDDMKLVALTETDMQLLEKEPEMLMQMQQCAFLIRQRNAQN